MNEAQQMVKQFHETFDCVISRVPENPSIDTIELRMELIEEEAKEVHEALCSMDVSKIAKELADLLYVVYGTAVSYGIDMEPVFAEVHRSNMSKVGGHKGENGKWVKPDNYSPANLTPILYKQLMDGTEESGG